MRIRHTLAQGVSSFRIKCPARLRARVTDQVWTAMPFAFSMAGPIVPYGLIFCGYLDVVMLPMTYFRKATIGFWLLNCQKWMRQKVGVTFLKLRQTFCVIDGVAAK